MKNLNIQVKKITGLTLLTGLLIFIPAQSFAETGSCLPEPQQDTTVILSVNIKGVHSYKATDGVSVYNFKYKGDIRITDDDKSIESISPGGYLSISKTTFGNKRSLQIESDSRGNLRYEYYEGRNEVPFEPEGKIWLDDVLLDVIRMTGIDAERRAGRIFARKGASGVLDEINQMNSNHVKGLYFRVLLHEESLTNQEMALIAVRIASSINSNSERGQIYRMFSERFLVNDEVSIAYFRGIAKMSSNSEIGSVLRNTIKKNELNDKQYTYLLYTASKMSSNSEKGSVLRSIDRLNLDEPELIEAYTGTLNSMSSNSERASAMRHLIKNQEIDDQALLALFNSLKRLSSSSEKGSVLRSFDNLPLTNKDIILAYFGVVNSIDSNSEKGRVLKNLINNQPVNKATMIAILITAKQMSSNSEMGSVLRASIRWLGEQDEKVMSVFFDAVNSMTSNSEQGNVLRRLINDIEITGNTRIMILESASQISSNTDKSAVLESIIQSLGDQDEAVMNAFFATVNGLSSSTEHGKVLRELIEGVDPVKRTQIKILESAAGISSNTEKAAVLVKLAEKMDREDEEIREAYIRAAQTLSSDSEYRRVMNEIY